MDDDRVAAQFVTVAIFDTGDAWDFEIIADADPWTVEGILREAYYRARDRTLCIREGVDDEINDD